MRAALHIPLLALVLILTSQNLLHAQLQEFTFEHLTTADGLTSNNVSTIVQDAQGFMWFGTTKGLHKYDGYQFVIYRHDEEDPHSLSDDRVSAIYEDREGTLWVGTSGGGLNRFDRATETFTHYRHDADDPHSLSHDAISAIYEAPTEPGVLWIGTSGGGLNRFDRKTGTFMHFRLDPNDPNYDYVRVIYEDREGMLWVDQARFDRRTETFTRYPEQDTTYHPEVFLLIDSLQKDNRRLASILQVGERQDLTQPLTLTEETIVLIVSVGEADLVLSGRWMPYKFLDHGWVENEQGDIIWRMEVGRARYEGSAGTRDMVQVGLLTLAPGAYRIRYQSDEGHSYDRWGIGGGIPRHPELWGIQLLRVTRAEAQRIEGYLKMYERPASATSGSVTALYEDHEGALWLGTTGGLNRFDREIETFTPYRHHPDDSNSLSTDLVRAVQGDQDGALWIGGRRGPPYGSGGLTRFDPATHTFTRFPYEPTNPHSFLGDWVQDIYVDQAGAVWVATRNNGINKVDPSASKFTAYRHDPRDPNSLSHNVVWAVHRGRDSTLWVGTDEGLDRLDRKTGRVTHYRHDPANPRSLSRGRVRALFEDRKGVLWVGTQRTPGQSGLNRFDRPTETFTRYALNGIESIYEDREGRLWMGTADGTGGLCRFDRATGTFTRYLHDPDDPTSISGNGTIGPVYEDSQGALWVDAYHGRDNALNRLDPETGRFTQVLLDPDRPRLTAVAIHEDQAGRFWAGTVGGGLFLLDRETGTSVSFTEQDGLPQDDIMGIASDEAGDLWISTADKGVVRFNPETGVVRTYDLTDGLPSMRYNQAVYFQSASGEIFFGSRDGVLAFYPEQALDNPYIPPVVLTGFTLRNKPVPVGADAPLKAHISVAESITLAHDQNDFSFAFAALNYRHPEKNRYAYRLEGYDEAWTEAGTSRQARYTNIPPGRYVFRVRGSNNDGVWNEQGASIRVTVMPPFWQTWWFRMLATALAIGLLALVYRLRVAHLLGIERLRMHIASDLHDDIGSKLSSIALMSEMVTDQAALDVPERQQLTEITDLARYMVEDLRDIVWMINPRYDRLENLVSKMQHQAATLLKGIQHVFHGSPDAFSEGLGMDRRRHLYLMYKEVLLNVARHAQASFVDITVTMHEGVLEVVVQDNGVGFDPQATHSGSGLISLHERARLVGGSVIFDSHPGAGTTVRITAKIPESRDGWRPRESV